MYGQRHITQKYLRRYGFQTRRARAWAGKNVHIRTENGVWRPNGHGYTNDFTQAWVLSFEDAVRRIDHCGPEKQGTFILAGGQPRLL